MFVGGTCSRRAERLAAVVTRPRLIERAVWVSVERSAVDFSRTTFSVIALMATHTTCLLRVLYFCQALKMERTAFWFATGHYHTLDQYTIRIVRRLVWNIKILLPLSLINMRVSGPYFLRMQGGSFLATPEWKRTVVYLTCLFGLGCTQCQSRSSMPLRSSMSVDSISYTSVEVGTMASCLTPW